VRATIAEWIEMGFQPPDPAWHFSGRSQSAAWTALNGPYRDAVLDDRSDEAAEIMATEIAPDFEYVGPRCQRALSSTDGGGVNLLEFEHDGDIWCSNGNIEEVNEPSRIDWLRWIDPVQEYTFASGGPERTLVGLEDWIPLEPMFGGFVLAEGLSA
jgi:hypothetical protein